MYLLQNLDFNYYNNPTAWMNEMIFIDYVEKLNIQLIKMKKSILLFIDNCSAHPTNISASNVKIIFLPANTTSVLQTIDAGIIKCFNGYYRVKMARYLIKWVIENQYGNSVKSNAV